MKLTVREFLDFLIAVKPNIENEEVLGLVEQNIKQWSEIGRYPPFMDKEFEFDIGAILQLLPFYKEIT